MNELDLCLEVVLRSCEPLHYIRHWISRKPLEMESWFQRTTNRKWPMWYQMVTWPMTSRDPRKVKQLEMQFSSNRWLLDSLMWGSAVGYPSDSLASCTYSGPTSVRSKASDVLCSSITQLSCIADVCTQRNKRQRYGPAFRNVWGRL